MTSFRLSQILLLAALLILPATAATAADIASPVDFNRDIRPLLSDRCFACHGPDDNERQGGFRLDVKESAFGEADSGAQPIVAGDVSASELYRRIASTDESERMPPTESNKKLSAEEIALFARWIEQGATWNEHWAFAAPTKSAPPEVKTAAWPKNTIDHFILARLEKEGLSPSAAADKATLLRRVTFDLTGLPPTLAELDAFLADDSPDAYEAVVDRLLRSPRYGEHMARFWLDAARYGDTHGLHLDNYREMWPYRDWVVRAFNANKPYDQFIVEQLAGDLLPNATLDQIVATGFNRCHVTTSEGGSIAEEVYVRNVIDRVVTTGTVMMGMTFECSRCHDHKYDPFTMNDFYSMFAFFNRLDGNPLDGNKAEHPPIATVPTPEASATLARVQQEIDAVQKQLAARRKEAADSPEFLAWQVEAAKKSAADRPLPEGMIGYYPLNEGSGEAVASAIQGPPPGKVVGAAQWKPGKHDGAFDFDGRTHIDLGDVANFESDQAFSYGAWINPRQNGAGAVLARMNDGNAHRGYDLYLAGHQVAVHIIHRWPDDAVKVTTKAALKQDQWQHVFATYDGSGKAAGVKIYFDGQEQPFEVNVDALRGTTKSNVSLKLGSRTPGSVYNGLVDDVRIYGRALAAEEVGLLAGSDPIGPILAVPIEKRTPEQVEQLVSYYLDQQSDEAYRQLGEKLAGLRKEHAAAEALKGTTLVWKEAAAQRVWNQLKPNEAYVLKRGDYEQKGEVVGRATPGVLPPLSEGAPLDRLGFARWLVDPSHPLTARVAVNRFWLQMFGTGIVKTAEDFGSQGEPPSHPELLDWLAVQFIDDGWDVKKLMKRIVMSAAYRQTSRVTPELLQRDPENRLLARGPRFRLDAEMLRDQALAVSGLLVEKLGGPSVKPPQPDGLWFAVGYSGSNTVRFKKDAGADKVYRRTLYTFIKRTAPPPQMSTFDAPSREACTLRRERTNTPMQVLLLMNDPQYVEAARALAARTLREAPPEPAARAAFMYRLCTSWQPDSDRLAHLLSFYEKAKNRFEQDAAAAAKLVAVGESPPDETMDKQELATWTAVANLVLCLDETVTKN